MKRNAVHAEVQINKRNRLKIILTEGQAKQLITNLKNERKKRQ